MKILYLTPRQCWPTSSGAKLRDYHLAKALGSASELSYVFYAEPGAPQVAAADLPFCRRVVSVPRPRPYTPGKLLRGIFGQWPLPIVNYTSPAMIEAVRSLLRQDRFDLVHIDIIHLAGCVDALRGEFGAARLVYGWHNIESELMRRYASGAGPWHRRVYAGMTAGRLERTEASILQSAGGHIVCSERERTSLLARAPEARIAVIENGVDTAAFAIDAPPRDRRRLVFVGAMSYSANIDAAVWFARTVWPEMRRKFPKFTFTIVGADPAAEVLALKTQDGVEVTGTVPDVRPYYQDAFAALVPLRVGAGTRLKILEAMAAGVPVVSTTLGAEGLAVTPDRNILIADRNEDWARALEALQDPNTREAIAAAARETACVRYDWRVIGQLMAETYQNWIARSSPMS